METIGRYAFMSPKSETRSNSLAGKITTNHSIYRKASQKERQTSQHDGLKERVTKKKMKKMSVGKALHRWKLLRGTPGLKLDCDLTIFLLDR